MISIYIHSLASERIGVIEEQGKVKEVIIDRPELQQQTGNIYLGKVVNIEKGLQAAFVQINRNQLGFLPRKELPQARLEKSKPIEQLITEGQTLAVQLKKDAYGTKAAFLTANITLPGVNLVYLPFGGYVAVSKKVEETTRHKLKEQVKLWLHDQEGAIIRTSAINMDMENLKQEYTALRERWKETERNSHKLDSRAILFQDTLIPDRLVRKFSPEDIDAVFVNDREVAVDLRKNYVHLKEKVVWEKNLDAKMSFSVNQLLERLKNNRVLTDGGIELVIEHTEAMTVIDINTATFKGKMDKQQTVVQANLNAATEAARQIRLRNISGMIVIDFISMIAEADKNKVLRKIKMELAKDPVRTEVYGFTQLGLLEMTRKRESPSLPYLLLEEKQPSFSIETMAYMLERELVNFSSSTAEAVLIEANPQVHHMFRQLIQVEKLRNNISQDVYFILTETIDSYRIKLAGSLELINEQMSKQNKNSIDNLF